jgi:hypothetical protein
VKAGAQCDCRVVQHVSEGGEGGHKGETVRWYPHVGASFRLGPHGLKVKWVENQATDPISDTFTFPFSFSDFFFSLLFLEFKFEFYILL